MKHIFLLVLHFLTVSTLISSYCASQSDFVTWKFQLDASLNSCLVWSKPIKDSVDSMFRVFVFILLMAENTLSTEALECGKQRRVIMNCERPGNMGLLSISSILPTLLQNSLGFMVVLTLTIEASIQCLLL